MFELVEGNARHIPSGGVVPVATSSAVYLALLAGITIVPLLFITHAVPEVPSMMAFVVAEPPAPPPPPPPPAPPKPRPAEQARANATPAPGPVEAAPIEAPRTIEPEAIVASVEPVGVTGGVEGGVPGGVAGGIVGGIPDAPPPPPPPAPAAPRTPVRVGGRIQQPALVSRVEPVYPPFAAQARIEGTVILEAIVNEHGEVTSLKVLRSKPLLDRAAIAAVQQWRYSPVILNGTPVPFVLTVVLTFTLPDESRTAARY